MALEQTINSDEKANLLSLSTNINERVQYKSVPVSSAEILALFATPKELVAAPGAGFVLELLSAVLTLDFNTAAYANNGILSIRETNAAGTAHSETLVLANFLAGVADELRTLQPAAGHDLVEDTPMVLSVATGETDTGDSPITVRVAYRVHATGL